MLRLFRAFNIDGKINLWAHCRDENTSRCKSYSRGWNPASVGLDLDHHFPTIHRVWTHFNYPNLCMTSASHHSSPDSMLSCDNKLEFFQAPRSRLWVMPQLARWLFPWKVDIYQDVSTNWITWDIPSHCPSFTIEKWFKIFERHLSTALSRLWTALSRSESWVAEAMIPKSDDPTWGMMWNTWCAGPPGQLGTGVFLFGEIDVTWYGGDGFGLWWLS